jgi:phosphocarrier protein HPr
METRKTIITAPHGMHARPASELVKLVRTLDPSKITISTQTKSANAASMFSIMALGLKNGTEITISAEGGNESEAAQQIADFIANITE